MKPVTVRRHIFEYFVDQQERWKNQPCRSEIRKIFSGLSDDVDLHLEQLAREGLLTFGADGEQIFMTRPYVASRLIKLQRDSKNGTPDVLALDLQAVGMDTSSDLLAQVVRDDSMIDAGMRRGDIAIYRAGAAARGEIVLAELSGKLAFRRYLIINDIPHLLAENLNQPDLLPAVGVILHGVLCCVISPRSKPVVDPLTPTTKKVDYMRSANLSRKRSHPPAHPSGFSLNEKAWTSYSAHHWTCTSEDQPEQAYQTTRFHAVASAAKGQASAVKKVVLNRVRASDVQPVGNPPRKTPKSKHAPQVRTRLRA